MPTATGFADLAQRLGTGLGMALVGLAAVWAGGGVFAVTVAAAIGLVVWELATMLGAAPRPAAVLGAAAGGALLLFWALPPALGLPLLLAAAIAGAAALHRNKTACMGLTALILVAGVGLLAHRQDFGALWMVWLVAVVGASDILGYFAGRLLGGPKFWPALSPKKTWSGTAAGWLGAALVGAGFALATPAGPQLIGLSVAVAMASQIGDIAESAVKRRVGVKNSSNLLPGHGGLFDRFDGMLGAALMMLVVEAVTTFPPGIAP